MGNHGFSMVFFPIKTNGFLHIFQLETNPTNFHPGNLSNFLDRDFKQFSGWGFTNKNGYLANSFNHDVE